MTNSKDKILVSMKEVLDSKIDLIQFADQFCFYYLQLPYDYFREECGELFDASTFYLELSDQTDTIPLEEVVVGAEFLNIIQETYQSVSDKPIGVLH